MYTTRQITFSNESVTPIDDINHIIHEWSSVATTADNRRMIISTLPYLYFTTFNTTTNRWNTPTQFGIYALGNDWDRWGYPQICVTSDGSRVMVTNFYENVHVYFWNGTTYTNRVVVPDTIASGRQWTGIESTPDGNTLVACVQYGGVYFTKWNNATGNYNTWTQTAAPDTFSNFITINENASKIVYGGGDNGSTPISYMLWNESTQNYGPNVIMFPEQAGLSEDWKGFNITRDGGILIAAHPSRPSYVIFNTADNSFGSLTPIPQMVHGNGLVPRWTWLSYDEKTLYYTVYGETNRNFIHQMDIQYTVSGGDSPSIPLYLGEEITVIGSTVNFANSSVSAKAPISELHMAIKGYVDTMHDESVDSLTQLLVTERIASNAELTTTISGLETIKEDLATQLNNLYQYFFNQSTF